MERDVRLGKQNVRCL